MHDEIQGSVLVGTQLEKNAVYSLIYEPIPPSFFGFIVEHISFFKSNPLLLHKNKPVFPDGEHVSCKGVVVAESSARPENVLQLWDWEEFGVLKDKLQ